MLVPRIFLSTLLAPLERVQSTKFVGPELGPVGVQGNFGRSSDTGSRFVMRYFQKKIEFFYQKSEKPLVFYWRSIQKYFAMFIFSHFDFPNNLSLQKA